jgi:hypothetical protein
MDRKDLSATSWVSNRLTLALFVLAAVFFAFEPAWLGFGLLADALGGRDRVHGVGLACAFLLLAALSWEKNQIRVQMAEVLEALNQLLYGKSYDTDRKAIEILLDALERGDEDGTAHKHLMRLTGQSFAKDAKVWRAWWEANRKRFERAR